MANRIEIEEMNFPFEFISPLEVTIEETSLGVAIIRGTLLREGVSKNGNLYTIKEMKKIAKATEGQPIYVGTTTKMDVNLGIIRKGMHDNTKSNKVGRIIQAIFNDVKRVIKFVGEVVNTENHPDIISKIKAGWGISIGGVAEKARKIIEETGRILTKVMGMRVTHVQLLAPWIVKGQEEAKVESVEIQESMIFYEALEKEITSIKLPYGFVDGITYS